MDLFALATLATRADEAEGPPPTKFYELRDNLMAGEHGDLLRDAVALVVRELMEAEVVQLTGAGRGER